MTKRLQVVKQTRRALPINWHSTKRSWTQSTTLTLPNSMSSLAISSALTWAWWSRARLSSCTCATQTTTGIRCVHESWTNTIATRKVWCPSLTSWPKWMRACTRRTRTPANPTWTTFRRTCKLTHKLGSSNSIPRHRKTSKMSTQSAPIGELCTMHLKTEPICFWGTSTQKNGNFLLRPCTLAKLSWTRNRLSLVTSRQVSGKWSMSAICPNCILWDRLQSQKRRKMKQTTR